MISYLEETHKIYYSSVLDLFYSRAFLVGGFLFLFSKQYKNNFQKIELEISFQIIIFTLYVFGSHF